MVKQAKRMRRGVAAAAAVAMGVVGVVVPLTGGTASAEDEPFIDETKLPFESLPEQDTSTSWGVLGAAAYRIEVPADWNGDIVMWAHGYRGEGLELTVSNPPMREHLIDQGFAWAASSYERNGYDVLTGVASTRILAEYTRDEVVPGPTGNIYLTGASMGGHVTGIGIEQDFDLYAGAMPICGVMGDYELFDYFLDINLGAQQLALGESAFPVDPAAWFSTQVPAIKADFEAAPGAFPFALSDSGETWKSFVEQRSGGVRPNFDEAFAFWNGFPTATGFGNFLFEQGAGTGVLPNSDGLVVVDNIGATYQLDDDSALSEQERAFNKDIARVAKDRFSRANEQITGDLRDRVMSLHNLGDLFVPFEMQRAYARDVRAQGKQNRLVQRAIRGVGHCDFTEYELATSFDDLVSWVETGVRPDGDDVLKKGEVGADDFGCKFSDPDFTLHQFAVPCGMSEPS